MLILYVGNIWSILGGPPLYLPPPPPQIRGTADSQERGSFLCCGANAKKYPHHHPKSPFHTISWNLGSFIGVCSSNGF